MASRANQSRSRDDGMTLNDCYIAAAAVRAARQQAEPPRARACRPYLAAELRLLRRVAWW